MHGIGLTPQQLPAKALLETLHPSYVTLEVLDAVLFGRNAF